MSASSSLNHIDSKSEFAQIGQLLDCISDPALLISESRTPVLLNDSAMITLDEYKDRDWSKTLLPVPAIWERVWNRIANGHTVETSAYLIKESHRRNFCTRVNLTISLLSSGIKPYALCVLSISESFQTDETDYNLSQFPDENPNPVMRISRDGCLLYANRASDLLLKFWIQKLNIGEEDDGYLAFSRSVKQNSLERTDINCGDRVYTVAFTPVPGSDYVNLYALDTTDKKRTEHALQTALDEVHELKNRLLQENNYLQDEIKQVHGSDEIIGNSDCQIKLLRNVAQVARTDATVLILGETGTGKELLARAIHAGSQRSDRPLVKVNCAALPSGLIESELFGHEKGAFTGAIARKTGRFEIADGGTIFLDEIGDLPLELQAKLLRVLQEGEIERVGSNRTIEVDARVIAATNRNLAQSISDGEFREDLFYRLNVFPIQSPPLRDRSDDIVILAHHFLNKYSVKIGKQVSSIDASTLARLRSYRWPGNVRELENVIERAIILSEGRELQLDESFDRCATPLDDASQKTLKEVERQMIKNALQDTAWKIEGQNGAATRLGMAPSTLRERMKRYGLRRPTNPTGSIDTIPG